MAIIILSMFYTLMVMRPAFHVIHYSINFDIYANELCENKDVPSMNCNGTCILAQKMQMSVMATDKIAILPQFESLYWYMGFAPENIAREDKPVQKDKQHFQFKATKYLSPSFNTSTPPPNVIV